MKKFEIKYNPYSNRIHFRQAVVKNDSSSVEWAEIEKDSSFLRYQNQRCIFENCVEEIIDLINKFINTSGELEIDFIGTDEDFRVLKTAIAIDNNPKSKGIICNSSERYISSPDALDKIKNAYDQIKTEFDDYIDNSALNENDDRAEIGREILKFQETVKAEIPVCVIGNYNVGKSALVNAFVGRELLPSHANSTTAKNVFIQNGSGFYISFIYNTDSYTIEITGTDTKTNCSGTIDAELVEALRAGTDSLETEEQILHQMLENLNNETSSDSKLAEIDSNVSIAVPFAESELDTDKYSFVFIDTPGSNNGDTAQQIHRQNLEKLMDEQTNALPVFVMDRKSITAADNNDLQTLLENKEAGFALQNCIIVISMSDQLVEQQLTEELPDIIRQWINHPTIMYTSPIAAIGEKKANKDQWIDGAYRQIYEKKLSDLSEVNPPQYNKTPCRREMVSSRKKDITPLLYASGLPSLETEINYFAYRFAEYKKCTNGREYLLRALDLADKKLAEAQKQLEKDKQSKEKEQKDIRTALKKKIDSVPLPKVNAVVAYVNKEYSEVLTNYCNGVDSLIRDLWKEYKGQKKAMDSFENAITKHCQENLYNANLKRIKEMIESSFMDLTVEYIASVRKIVTDEYEKLSEEAQNELNALFDENDKGPTLQDVKVGALQKIKLILLGALPFDKAQDLFVEQYSRKFKDKLQGTKRSYGLFTLQCIAQPAEEYNKQIRTWSNAYKDDIDLTLNKDNSILSKLDEKIGEMEDMIEDMERRLKNLASVKAMLSSLLPREEDTDGK